MASDVSSQRAVACQIGAAMVLGTLVAIIIVDRSGRRTLLIAGGVQMCLAEVSSCLAGSAHAPLPRPVALLVPLL